MNLKNILFLLILPLISLGEISLDLHQWESSKGGPVPWSLDEGVLTILPGSGDIQTKEEFENLDLHIEFWIPNLPNKSGQDKGNSGIFFQGLYEIQILDSYQNETYFAGTCGSLYKVIPPLLNVSLPPENWQSYDIRFVSPKIENEKVILAGTLDVRLNGTLIIDQGHFTHPTGSAYHKKQWGHGPLRLQDHGSAVKFRNLKISPF